MLVKHRDNFTGPFLEIVSAARAAVRAIPPAFPLDATVAVNPFLGQTGLDLAQTAALLARVGGIAVTPPRSWYAGRIEAGAITPADIAAAVAAAPAISPALTPEEVLAAARRPAPAPQALPTVADLAARLTGTDWPAIMLDRIGAFLGPLMDQGQALWPAARGRGLYDAWRAFAMHDLVPEIAGLAGFAAHVAAAPDEAWMAVAQACDRIGIGPEAAACYFHALLHRTGGWGHFARHRLWEAERRGESDDSATDLLALCLVWEEALAAHAGPALAPLWAEARAAWAAPVVPSREQLIDAVLQEAAERAHQRGLAATLAAPAPAPSAARPKLQAAFCIDVRSEVFRRALESLDPGIRTLGFAGFFGLPLAHRPLAAVEPEAHLPVLLAPGMETAPDIPEAAETALRVAQRARRAWGRFRQAAVSSFAFVEAAGPLYAGKLLRDALGLGHAEAPGPAPRLPALPLETRIATAAAVLGAMSLRQGFAPLVLLVGHGANVTNNAHESALHCGACGGQTGEVSARALARLLNDPEVRAGLPARGIELPPDTRFVAALHDTTTDSVTLHDVTEGLPGLAEVRAWLAEAGRLARAERAVTLPRAGEGGRAIPARARDWAETRPEWGLAGCAAFIAAPRARTAGRPLGGRAFLHDYDWRADAGFGTLELILTAPVVVASWISLAYYGAVVAPEAFGGGNKLLHNVIGGFGVLEGNGGAPRTGLPWQSVHDGARFVHEPLRLSVLVEAPVEAITDILARHEGPRALFDNRWLHLFALDAEGRMAARYAGALTWEEGAAARILKAVAAA